MSVLRTEQLTFIYPQGRRILSGIDFEIAEGEFVLLSGPSGSGKTTFMRCLKAQIAPVGMQSGSVTQLPAKDIGFVFQNPDNQIVTDTVRHELAFGLENMGVPTDTIRRRVAETALFFGIDSWIDASVHEISGGQKQLLNLAAVIAMRPRLLILDEPASQLDPVARKNFLELLVRVNRELGIAVLLSEHQMGDILPVTDRVLFMKDGRIAFDGDVQAYVDYICNQESAYERVLPAAVRIAKQVEETAPETGMEARIKAGMNAYPITVREGRSFLLGCLQNPTDNGVGGKANERVWTETHVKNRSNNNMETCLHVDHIWFQYARQTPFVLQGLELLIRRGELHAVLGGNGSGKTTLLHILGKRIYANRGKIRLGKDKKMPVIGLLPQNPKGMFSRDTVEEELFVAGCSRELTEQFRLTALLGQHPYDLSGGEQQRLGLAMVLAKQPDLLLLDEPTKGLDAFLKEELAGYLKNYTAQGHTVLCVTHDVEFAAAYADVCSLLFRGEVLVTEETNQFFWDNAFYTTDRIRILRGL